MHGLILNARAREAYERDVARWRRAALLAWFGLALLVGLLLIERWA